MERRILVVDVDGVLCDLVGSAIPLINSLFDCNLNRTAIRDTIPISFYRRVAGSIPIHRDWGWLFNVSGVVGDAEKQNATFWQLKACLCAIPTVVYRVWCR